METAVSMALAGVFCQPRAWDDLGDAGLLRLQGEPEDRSLAGGVPHSRRNLWKPQAED